jgi:AcrR family transcriptional regulator
MSKPVKTRRYESPRRREQAAATRLEILEAAQRLFERDGYAKTTIAAIAGEAGVAVKTVYLAFDTKSGVLRALWHLRLRGDTDSRTVEEREWYREVLDERDAAEQLRLNARNSRLVKLRVAPLLGVIHAAASVDPDIRALWSTIQEQFHANQRAVAESLADKGALRADLDVERAADILWALNHPALWQLLVELRGWTPDEYERWFDGVSRSELLG